MFLSSWTDYFSFLLPVKNVWWAIFGVTLQTALTFIYDHLSGVSIIAAIGTYGVSIIVLTIIIRALLSPLTAFQLTTQRKSMMEQRKLAPQVGELRKKYRKDPQKMNAEMMKLYQEHGVNPLGGLVGCLPLLIQMPILYALYYVFTGFGKAHASSPLHFLFVPSLNDLPNHHLLFAWLPYIPVPAYLVFPLLAALTTFVQSKMLQVPPVPNPTEQELQTQQMQRTMVYITPLMIAIFSLNVPAGLGLYWFVGNCVSIIQQYFVVGWGQLWPSRAKPLPGASAAAPSPPLKGQQAALQKNGPAPGAVNLNKAGTNVNRPGNNVKQGKRAKNRGRS